MRTRKPAVERIDMTAHPVEKAVSDVATAIRNAERAATESIDALNAENVSKIQIYIRHALERFEKSLTDLIETRMKPDAEFRFDMHLPAPKKTLATRTIEIDHRGVSAALARRSFDTRPAMTEGRPVGRIVGTREVLLEEQPVEEAVYTDNGVDTENTGFLEE